MGFPAVTPRADSQRLRWPPLARERLTFGDKEGRTHPGPSAPGQGGLACSGSGAMVQTGAPRSQAERQEAQPAQSPPGRQPHGRAKEGRSRGVRKGFPDCLAEGQASHTGQKGIPPKPLWYLSTKPDFQHIIHSEFFFTQISKEKESTHFTITDTTDPGKKSDF